MVRLDPRQFTPLTRTPWAGYALARGIKARWLPTETERIGESWEFSLSPPLVSRLLDHPASLQEWIAIDPVAALSPHHVATRGTEPYLMVKLLEALEPLSLQVHPPDGYPALATHECGKSESWYVLSAQEGAGIYLGLRPGVDRQQLLQACSENSPQVCELLQFIPVTVGDYFNIAPGTPHSLGPGVLVAEPQSVVPGREGKTYRLWDWGRKFLPDGSRDDIWGTPRELDLAGAVALLGETDSPWVRHTGVRMLEAPWGSFTRFPSFATYQTQVLTLASGSGGILEATDTYAVVLVVRGSIHLASEQLEAAAGLTLFVAASCGPLAVEADAASQLVVFNDSVGKIDWRPWT